MKIPRQRLLRGLTVIAVALTPVVAPVVGTQGTTAVAQADARAPLTSTTTIQAARAAIADVSTVPLPALPAVTFDYDPELDALGTQRGATITLNPTADYWTQTATAIHEIGHVLDREGGIDPTPVVHAMRHTRTVQALFVDAQDGDDWCQYAIDPGELFARGFAQWIADRTGDKHLIAAVKSFGRGQWPAEEFRTIAPAYDALFGAQS